MRGAQCTFGGESASIVRGRPPGAAGRTGNFTLTGAAARIPIVRWRARPARLDERSARRCRWARRCCGALLRPVINAVALMIAVAPLVELGEQCHGCRTIRPPSPGCSCRMRWTSVEAPSPPPATGFWRPPSRAGHHRVHLGIRGVRWLNRQFRRPAECRAAIACSSARSEMVAGAAGSGGRSRLSWLVLIGDHLQRGAAEAVLADQGHPDVEQPLSRVDRLPLRSSAGRHAHLLMTSEAIT